MDADVRADHLPSGLRQSKSEVDEPKLPTPKPEGDELQRSVFDWIPPPHPEDRPHRQLKKQDAPIGSKLHATITAHEIATKHGVPPEHLIKYVAGEIAEAESCQSLPFTLLMVIFYSVMVYMHDNPAVVNSVEDSIVHDITENANFAFSSAYIGHKNIDDVNSLADFWSWVINGYLPLTFIQETVFSEDLDLADPAVADARQMFNRSERGLYLNYNRIIGGVRMSQERSGLMECATVEDLLPVYDKLCVGISPYELYPEMPMAFTGENASLDLAYKFWLWAADDYDESLGQLQEKELEHWLDDQTKKVQLYLPVYNAEYGLYTLVSINFYFSRGGHIWKRIIAMSTWAEWTHGYENQFVDFMWVMCLVYIVLNEIKKMSSAYKTGSTKGLRNYLLNFYIFVDWFAIIVALVIIGLFRNVVFGSDALNELVVEMASFDEVTERADYRAKAEEVVEKLEFEVLNVYYLRWILGVYPGLNVMRLFKAFAAQPRLSIVTSTLSTASIDLVHFLLVFASIFCSYAIFGVRLFGREVDGFITFGRSLNTCFRIMMGDFDWEELSITGRPEAMIWFVSYMVIVVLIMLNMLLAIVMDAYGECKAGMANAETLLMECRQTYERFVGTRTGKTVSLKVVLHELMAKEKHVPRKVIEVAEIPGEEDPEDLPDPKAKAKGRLSFMTSPKGPLVDDGRRPIVDIDWLCRSIPKMKPAQATEMIECAINDFYDENKEDANIDEMLTVIRKVNWSTKTLKRKMFRHAELVMPDAIRDSAERKKGSADSQPEIDEPDVVIVTIPAGAFPGDTAMAECAQGSATFQVPDGHKPGESIRLDISACTIQKPIQFMEELNKCYGNLKGSQNWIADCEVGSRLSALSAAAAGGRAASAAPVLPERWPGEPLESLDEIQEWSVVQVMEYKEQVLDACHACGIQSDNDDLRSQACGRLARVVAMDADDGTVKCRVPEVGDVWFAIGSLTHSRLPDEDDPSRQEVKEQEAKDGHGDGLPPHEDILKQVKHLDQEITVGKQTVAEALTAVSELEWRLLREHEEKAKVKHKFELLKRKVTALARENRKLCESVRQQAERINVVVLSRDEYAELVQNLRTENERLREKAGPLTLDDAYSDGGGGKSHGGPPLPGALPERGRRHGPGGGRRSRGGNQLAVVSEDVGTSPRTSPDQVNLTLGHGAAAGRREGGAARGSGGRPHR